MPSFASQITMKSPVYPKYESGDSGNGYEFDFQLDFSQFLEEARQHARAAELEARLAEEKRSKKSWKKYLFFKWWKFDTKKSGSRSKEETPSSSHIPRSVRRRHVSGPVYGIGGLEEIEHGRQTSGPITSLLDPAKNETPYMCLDDNVSNSNGVKAYGPLYLIT